MIEAIVLVNTEFDSSQKQVLENLQQISGVEEAHATFYSVYDFVAEVQTKTLDELRTIVLENIGKIEAVDSTTTLIVGKKWV